MTALIWWMVAHAQVVDTVGGTSSNNVGNLDYKLNVYDVDTAVRLQLVEMYLEEQWFGASDLTWVVFHQNGASTWDLVWEANGTVGALDRIKFTFVGSTDLRYIYALAG